jgi:osmotically-inducible protein OsmY
MNRTKSLFAAAVGCMAFVAGVAVADEAVSDSALVERVTGKLSVDDPAVVRRMKIEAKDGVVTVTGKATTPSEAAKVLRDVQSVAGVQKVKNDINIQL